MDGFSFVMGALVGFAALPVFWFALAVVSLILWSLVVYERGGWATTVTIVLGVLLVSKFPVISDYFTWGTFALAIPAFGIIGVLWARFKWSRFISKAFDNAIERRKRFLDSFNLPADYFNSIDEKLAAEMEDEQEAIDRIAAIRDSVERKAATEALQKKTAIGIFTAYVKESRDNNSIPYDYKYKEFKTIAAVNAAMAPLAAHNKGSIVMWIAYWPISVVWYIVGDLLADLGREIYNMVAGNFQNMSDSKFKQM